MLFVIEFYKMFLYFCYYGIDRWEIGYKRVKKVYNCGGDIYGEGYSGMEVGYVFKYLWISNINFILDIVLYFNR